MGLIRKRGRSEPKICPSIIRNHNAYSDQVLDEVISIYVAVDETGNLGSVSPFQREYAVVGCVVMDRDRFMKVSYKESMKKGHEVKFYNDRDLREAILRESEPFVEQVYYVRYHKDKRIHNSLKTGGLTTEEKHNLHLAMMRALANAIITDYGGEIHVDIDANSLVRDYEAIDAFEGVPHDLSDVHAHVEDSKTNYGLQTNDFFVGAVGHMVNGPSSNAQDIRESNRYVNIFRKKLKRVFLRDDDWGWNE